MRCDLYSAPVIMSLASEQDLTMIREKRTLMYQCRFYRRMLLRVSRFP